MAYIHLAHLRVVSAKALICAALISTPAVHAGTYQDAVSALGFNELAETFTLKKSETISQQKQSPELDESELQALAVLKLLGAPSDPDALKIFVAQYDADDTAYLGDLTEPSLYQRIETRWDTASAAPRSDFAIALRAVISQGVATGYNIYTTPWPKFARERHVVYGHNDIDHAQQLLALLTSEGLHARVGLSLKTSAFLYRDDWGTLSQPLIDIGNDRRLIETQEFDLHFEFPEESDKARFTAVINKFAKKNRADQTGLIRNAWWQPYYRSLIEAPDFIPATQILVSDTKETAVLLTLPEKASKLVKDITNINKTWQIHPETIWVNPAFYRYLGGDYK